MIQISIKKQEQLTNQGLFSSMEEAKAWLAHHEGMKTFGQPKQIVQQQMELEPAVIEKQMVMIKEAELDEEGNELSPAEFEEQDVIVKEAVIEMQEVELAGDYEVEVLDITSQLEQEKINAEALLFLQESDWKRQRHLSQKALGINTSITDSEYLAMEQACQDARNRIIK
jgi:hypothetical protein